MIINELIAIIKSLGGSASLAQITKEFFNNYKIMEDRAIIASIEAALEENKNLVYFDNSDSMWHMAGKDKIIERRNKNVIRRSDLLADIKEIKKNYFNNDETIRLYEDRNSINYKGVQLFSTRTRYKLCFENSNIKSQEQLNSILKKCIVNVHYGNASNYKKITWDISKCNLINAKGYTNPENGYFSCDDIDVELAVELFRELTGK